MIEIIPNWHPIFVHFSIAAVSMAIVLLFVCTLFSQFAWSKTGLTVGYWNLWIGALLSVGTVIAGIIAFNTVAHDEPSHLAMTDHKNWALVTFVVIAAAAVYSVRVYKVSEKPTSVLLVLLLAAGILLGTTGLKGGELVYRFGLGVMSRPDASGIGHDHEHSNGGHSPAATVNHRPDGDHLSKDVEVNGSDGNHEDDHDHLH